MVPSGLPKWLRTLIHYPEVLALKGVDHIVALTPSSKEQLISIYKLASDKITSVPTGIAVNDINRFLEAAKCNRHSNLVLCTGLICQRKNQFTAVKAIAKVINNRPEVKLILVGKTGEVEYLETIKKYIKEKNLTGHVEFRGELTKQKLYELYGDANIFLFPTTAEIQPAVVMESLAFGLPIVASNIGPNADILKDQGCAFLTDPFDVDGFAEAVTKLLNDAGLRQRMSDKAMRLGQLFSYDSIAKQTLSLYEKMVLVRSNKK
jgi:glycosyltransferase involved in cell wall biosynthesis